MPIDYSFAVSTKQVRGIWQASDRPIQITRYESFIREGGK